MANVLCSEWNLLRSNDPRTLEMVLIYKQMTAFLSQAYTEAHARARDMARADYNRTYRKGARMKQITGLLDFIDEHIDQHWVSVIQIRAQISGDIR